jgi:RNA polymerase sigma factor for flagellar operon FliA
MATLPQPPGDLPPEQLFLGHLKLIEEIIAHCCRRSRFQPQEAQDFGQEVMVKLIEDDYAVLRKYEGRSSLKTYLTVTIKRQLLDYQNHIWQKWRNSAEAGRLGEVAKRLEDLLVRDEISFDEACQMLRSQGVDASDEELEEIRTKLPPRYHRHFLPEEKLQAMSSSELPPDERLEQKELAQLGRRIYGTFLRTLQILPKEEQVLVWMRTRYKVADIARMLRRDQKPLYRQLDKIYERLQKELEKQGVRRQDIEDLLRRLQPGFLDF